MKYLLLVISVFTGSAKSLLTKQIKSKEENYSQLFIDNTIAFFTTLIAIFVVSFFSNQSLFYQLPIFLAMCYAFCTLLSQICLLLATGSGSVSISSLFYSCGFIIPTFFGAIKYGEKITALHVVAILMIVASFFLSASKDKEKKFNLKWLHVSHMLLIKPYFKFLVKTQGLSERKKIINLIELDKLILF